MSIEQAFHKVCTEAKEPSTFHVCLMVSSPYYGGPEEGGWWGSDRHLVAYQSYSSEEEANRIAEKVKKLAEEMNEQSKRDYGELCLNQMEWCENRGLDYDYLGEVDGEENYYVFVGNELPELVVHGPRHYS